MIHLHGTQAVAYRVLIVDTDPTQRDILARCVEMLGWTADAADNPEDAVRKFSDRPHNVVVIDLRLGRPECLHLLRALRRDQADPVVIFVSGAGNGTHAAAMPVARELGLRVAGTLARPVDPYSLHGLLLANPVRKRGEQRRGAGLPSAEDLDRALRGDEIHTEYQPKTDLVTGEIVGVEALARWHSPTLGLISPDQFVPIAEQSDLIERLTFRVMDDALAACRRWRAMRPNCSVAVNLSPHVLTDPRLLPMVDAILGEHRLPPSALIAEITEGTIISNLPAATEMLRRLSIKGVLVSIDDFGTGYSSLLSLLRMPFAELKIDRSFVGICRTDPEAWKLVRTTVSMARELGMHVVAEGIETEAVSNRLREAGCDTGQGWYFGHPMQEEAMSRWLTPAAAPRATAESSLIAKLFPANAVKTALALQS
jgi:EAL domain-containing protein (putative c-di-GMP-specific phosphodiesterase class I)/ActR/RegA family two-component response regulator